MIKIDNNKSDKIKQSDKKANFEGAKKSSSNTNVSKKPVKEIKAKLRFLRMSPTKVRLVTNLVWGMKAVAAVDYLQLVNKAASVPIRKLVSSAMANAVNNFGLTKENLYIKQIIVNQGPTLKRWQPRAHGRATPIRKRSSHIEVILGEKKEGGDLKRESKIKKAA